MPHLPSSPASEVLMLKHAREKLRVYRSLLQAAASADPAVWFVLAALVGVPFALGLLLGLTMGVWL